MAKKLLVIACLLVLLAPVAHAQEAGDICTLRAKVKLFSAKRGKKQSGKLKKGSEVVLKAEHGKRWEVEGPDGKVGFIKRKRLKKSCTFSKPEPAVLPDTEAPAQGDPNTEGNPDEVGEADAEAAQEESEEVQCGEPSESATHRVAFSELKLTNIPEPMGKLISKALIDELRKLEGVSVVGMEDIRGMVDLEAEGEALGCESLDEPCLAQILGKLGFDEMVTGQLVEGPDGRVMAVHRINQCPVELLGSVNKQLAIGTGEEFLLGIGPTVQELFPNREILPGSSRGVEKRLLSRINPPPIPAKITWYTLGATLGVIAMGSTFLYLGADQADSFNSGAGLEEGFVPGETFTALEASSHRNTTIGNVTLVLGGAAALAGVVMSLFTDWDDVASENEIVDEVEDE